MPTFRFTTLEPLETRIAPANVFPNPIYPLPDVVAGPGQTGAIVDLSHIFDSLAESPYRTILKITTNFDTDLSTPGIQAGEIYIELYDDVAPLTVQNFLAYAFNKNAKGDYDGTFFHRLAEGFVLQGGGYQGAGKKISHIDTLNEVHNEFDPSRSNLRGTLALAKTGAGPNTGTSEWFINLADNSQNLDNQNGGFTVFGEVLDMPGVVDGMEVVDKIAGLPTFEVLSGSGFKAPVQGFDPAKGGKPGKNNLIRIENVEIVPPKTSGSTGDLNYQVLGVKKVEGGIVTPIDSDLLTSSISGSKLSLSYANGKAGVAEVTVRISQSDDNPDTEDPYVDETFLVAVQPNLVTHLIKDTLPVAMLPGDTAKVNLELLNTGGAAATGDVKVQFYLVAYNRTGTPGQYSLQIADPMVRIDLPEITQAIDIGSGSSAKLKATIQIPNDLTLPGETFYQLRVEVVGADGFAEELFTDDNTTEGAFHQIHNRFGSFTTSDFGIGRSNAVLTYVEADGDVVQLSLKGSGTGKVVPGEDGIVDLELSGTTASTKVFAKVISVGEEGDGNISLRNIDSISVLGSLQFGSVDVSGDLAFSSGVKKLFLDDVTGPAVMSIGLFAGKESQRTTLNFGSVRDLNLDSVMPINSLTAREWLDTGSFGETILAPELGSLRITGGDGSRGDFEADLDVTGTGKTKLVRIAGVLNESVVRISGDVNSAIIGAIDNSSFLVGAYERPSELRDFIEFSTVKRFEIAGGVDGVTNAFVNSTVAAETFRNIAIRGVDGASGGEAFGVVANTIGKYSRDGGNKLKNLSAPTPVLDAVGNYRVQIL